MKKKWILLFVLLLTASNMLLFAQRNERRRADFEELKEKRVAFLTKAMDLSTKEAEVFWPLYNELQEKKIELNLQIRRALRPFFESRRDGKKNTEAEYKEIVNLFAKFKVKEAKLEEDYILIFSKVISYEKIFKYQHAEQQFARQLLDQRRERGVERGN